MITKRRLRYYCEFCKKSGASAWHMRNHEKHCTMNPERECGMCHLVDDAPVRPRDLKHLFSGLSGIAPEDFLAGQDVAKEVLLKLNGKCAGCPACMLAAIRQNADPVYFPQDFYKKARESFLEAVNDELRHEEFLLHQAGEV